MENSTKTRTRRGPSYCVMGLLILAIVLLAGITIWQFIRVSKLYSQGQADLSEVKAALSSLEKYAKVTPSSSDDKYSVKVEIVSPEKTDGSISSVEDVVAIVQSANSQSLATINNYLVIFSILITVVVIAIPIFNYLFIQKEQIERMNAQYAEYDKHLIAETSKLNKQYREYEKHLVTELEKVKKSIEMMQTVTSNNASGQEKGERATEIAPIKPISESNVDKAFAHKIKAQMLDSKKQFDQAIKEISEAIDLVPDNAEYYDYRSLFYHRIKNYSQALADENKAIELNPNKAEYFYGRGAAQHELKRYEEALEDKNKATELDPNNARYYISRGITLHVMKRYEEALADKNKAIELNPKNALYYDSRSATLHEMKRYEEALADSNKAIELDPNNAQYYDSRATTLFMMKRYEATIQDEKKAIEMDMSNQDYRASLAFYLYLNKEYMEALICIETIDNTFSSHIVCRVRAMATLKKLIIAHKKVTQKQRKQILDELQEAIRIKPDNLINYIYYAQALLELDELEDARKALVKAREMNSEEPETYHWLGVCYRKTGDEVNAALNDKLAAQKGYIPEPE